MNKNLTPVTLTPNQIVVLRTLENGPVKWSPLRKAYFGEARAKEQASTSFYQQLKGQTKKGLITKTEDGTAYMITDLGLVSIQAVSAEIKAAAKSNAQVEFEAKHGVAAVKAASAAAEPASEPV
jgi:predicted transcriptional regulator